MNWKRDNGSIIDITITNWNSGHSLKSNLTEDRGMDDVVIHCCVRDKVTKEIQTEIQFEGTQSGMALNALALTAMAVRLREFILYAYASDRDSRIVWTIQGFGDFTLQEFLQLNFFTTLNSAMLSRRGNDYDLYKEPRFYRGKEYSSDQYRDRYAVNYEDHRSFWVKNRLQDNNPDPEDQNLDYYVYDFTNFYNYGPEATW